MKFYSLFSIFGIFFLFCKFFDVIISSFDVFDWITAVISKDVCSFSNKTVDASAMNILTWVFFAISLVIIFIFLWSFCCSSLLCLCVDENECGYSVSPSSIKLFVEISILAALFNPVSHIKLLLRDCLPGYAMVASSLLVYFVTVMAFIGIFAYWFNNKGELFRQKGCVMLLIVVCGSFQLFQVAACLFAFASFFSFPLHPNFTNIKYGLLALTILTSFSLWVKGTIIRFSMYNFLLRSRDEFYCEKCCIDLVANLINLFTSGSLMFIMIKYLTNLSILHHITFILLIFAVAISAAQSMINSFFCVKTAPKYQFVEDTGYDNREELVKMDIENSS